MPVDRKLVLVVLVSSFAKRKYWPASQVGKHSKARRLRAAARRRKEERR